MTNVNRVSLLRLDDRWFADFQARALVNSIAWRLLSRLSAPQEKRALSLIYRASVLGLQWRPLQEHEDDS